MSWDIILMKTGNEFDLPLEQCFGEKCYSLDTKKCIELLKSEYPTLDYSDPTWIILESRRLAFEMQIVNKEQIVLHMRLSKKKEVKHLLNLLTNGLQCGAFDTTSDEWIIPPFSKL